MQALIVTALVETEFDVTLTATDLTKLQTIQDLHELVISRV